MGSECSDSSECRLYTGCALDHGKPYCICTALSGGEQAPASCPECTLDFCAALGAKAAVCAAGQCVPGYDCSPTAPCNSPPPACQTGMVPSVVDQCWGPCVSATECREVSSCSQCTGPLTTCVTTPGQAPECALDHRCVNVPVACQGAPSCACMGASVCTPPYDTCVDKPGVPGVVCTCPTC